MKSSVIFLAKRILHIILLPVMVVLLTGCKGNKPLPEFAKLQQPELAGELTFTDISVQAGLGEFRHITGARGDKWFPESVGAGGGFIDYNGDGWLDILLVGGGVWPGEREVPALWLYQNNCDGTFSLVTDEAGLANVFAFGQGIAVADYDNDGDEDFFFSTLYENMLFQNNGDGRFTEVGQSAGLSDERLWSTSAIFFDADKDSWPDLYVGTYVEWSPETDLRCSVDGVTKSYCTPELYNGVPGRYYRNNGDGTFTDQTDEAGFLASPGKTFGMAELDFNDDGWSDLFVSNDTERDLLFENNGDGTFTEKGKVSGIAFDENGRARAGMGVDTGVLDSSGQQSIVVGNFAWQMIGLYKHVGNGIFLDQAASSNVGRSSLKYVTFATFLFDVDLDGDLDLFAANGHVIMNIADVQEGITYCQPQQLFLNDGNGKFTDISGTIGGVFEQRLAGRGAAYGDIDRDGDSDILITENAGPVHLWRNETANAHFVRVHLEGRLSSRDALGVKVIACVGRRRIERRVRAGSSFMSSSEKTITFGLSDATSVDSLYIYWPNSSMQTFYGITADTEIRIIEGMNSVDSVAMAAHEPLY